MMKACLSVTILLFAVAGCTVGPNYQQPEVNTPASWRQSNRGGTTDAAAQDAEWWKTFGDPHLDSLIERAVKANYDLRIALGRLREARALRSSAVWDLGPTINILSNYTKEQRSRNSLTFPVSQLRTELYDAQFDAGWEVDIFGGKRRTLEAATAGLSAAEEDRRDVLLSVVSEVARNYVELRGFQERLAVSRRNTDSQTETLELTRVRFNAGLSSELDVRRAEAQLATTQSQLPVFETSIKQATHRLSVLLGQEPSALYEELFKEAPIPATPPVVPVGLPSDLLRRRPDVRRAERQLAQATANIGVATAEFFPKFSLTGTAGYQSLHGSDWFSDNSGLWSIGPSASWRLLDFGRVRAQIDAADARQEQALASYEQTVLAAFEEVENALAAYANEQLRYKSLSEAVTANRRAVDLANELYTKGLGDFLSVLDAERSLYLTEDQQADSRRAVTENLVALYKALGGGWLATDN